MFKAIFFAGARFAGAIPLLSWGWRKPFTKVSTESSCSNFPSVYFLTFTGVSGDVVKSLTNKLKKTCRPSPSVIYFSVTKSILYSARSQFPIQSSIFLLGFGLSTNFARKSSITQRSRKAGSSAGSLGILFVLSHKQHSCVYPLSVSWWFRRMVISVSPENSLMDAMSNLSSTESSSAKPSLTPSPKLEISFEADLWSFPYLLQMIKPLLIDAWKVGARADMHLLRALFPLLPSGPSAITNDLWCISDVQ